MKKVYLIIFILLAFPFFQAKADLLIEKDDSTYVYQRNVCNIINNLEDIKNAYNFYYFDYYLELKKFDKSDFYKISNCFDKPIFNNIVLVSKTDISYVEKYNLSIKDKYNYKPEAILKNAEDSGFIIFLYRNTLEASGGILAHKDLLKKQQESVDVNIYYNLLINNKTAVFTKTSGSVVKKESNKSMENIALTVVITSFISIIVLLFIKRKFNKKVNE